MVLYRNFLFSTHGVVFLVVNIQVLPVFFNMSNIQMLSLVMSVSRTSSRLQAEEGKKKRFRNFETFFLNFFSLILAHILLWKSWNSEFVEIVFSFHVSYPSYISVAIATLCCPWLENFGLAWNEQIIVFEHVLCHRKIFFDMLFSFKSYA